MQTVFDNAAFAGKGSSSSAVQQLNYTSNHANGSAEWIGTLSPSGSSSTTIELSAIASGEFRCWLGGHLALDTHALGPGLRQPQQTAPKQWQIKSPTSLVPPVINITVPSKGMLLRCQLRGFASPPYSAQLLVRETGPAARGLPQSGAQPVPSSWLSTSIPDSDAKFLQFRNETLQNGGWNTWENLHMLNFVRLPSAAELRLDLVERASGALLGNVHVFRQDNPARVQPGLHSLNDSAPFFMEVNVSRWREHDCVVAFAASAGELDALLVARVHALGPGCDDLAVRATAKAEWGRPFDSTVSHQGQFDVQLPGLSSVSFFSTQVPDSRNMSTSGASGDWSLADGATFGFSSDQSQSISQISAVLDQGRQRVASRLLPTPAYWRDAHAALHSVIGWNTIYTPYEGMISPVSRGWDFGKQVGANYVLFDWDNLFLAQMAAVDSIRVGWANLLQILRAATAQPDGGFVPNFSAGERKSFDRTEPYVGAQAALDLWARSAGLRAGLSPAEAMADLSGNPAAEEWKWAIESVVQQLRGWNDWVVARRTGPAGIGAVVLGSDPPSNAASVNGGENTLQAARYESGLDNSPAYDGNDHQCCGPVRFDNVTTHHMNLYDVGMASLYLADTEALAVLLALTGDQEGAREMEQRLEKGKVTLAATTLDPTDGRYWNRLYNYSEPEPASFYKRDIAPLFYPLIPGIPPRQENSVQPLAAALGDPMLYNLAAFPPVLAGVANVMPGVAGTNATSSAAQLTQFWSEGMTDNDAVAHPASVGTTIYTGRTHIRTEAIGIAGPPADAAGTSPYRAASNDTDVVEAGLQALNAALLDLGYPSPVPLWRYYCSEKNDSLTAPAVPASDSQECYVRQGLEAFCLNAPFPGSVQLTLWYSSNRQDYQLCGTSACLHDVSVAQYVQVGSGPMCYAWSGAESPGIAPLPSVARNDPAFQDNSYWRGRTWGPMVYLVYQGLWRYRGVSWELDAARSTLVERGRSMVLTNWAPFGHVFENSNGTTGYGADAHNADPFYHWGALAGYIGMREAGLV